MLENVLVCFVGVRPRLGFAYLAHDTCCGTVHVFELDERGLSIVFLLRLPECVPQHTALRHCHINCSYQAVIAAIAKTKIQVELPILVRPRCLLFFLHGQCFGPLSLPSVHLQDLFVLSPSIALAIDIGISRTPS